MSDARRILLINPTITARRSARFPLAVLGLAEALDTRYTATILDGNVDRNFILTAQRMLGETHFAAVGVTVMGGPQLKSAIAVSKALRARAPGIPIVWGGAFPTNCPAAALESDYVDFAVRGQGEATFNELLEALGREDPQALRNIAGLSWRQPDGQIVHNKLRAFSAARLAHPIPYERLPNPAQYLSRTYLGQRTAGYQAALGCRYRCTFCGVAAMFRGKTALPTAARLEQDLRTLTRLGADAIQFYDHNFFDREVDMVQLFEVLAKFELPWWSFARSDALVNMSERSWELLRRSRLRMAYIGAESPSEWLLHEVRKGTRLDQTLAAVEVCRGHGVTPELSFMLAPPQDPEGETEKAFEFIRLIKRRYPDTEIMIYIYTPLPPPAGAISHAATVRATSELIDAAGNPVVYPATADGWAEPQWLAYWCHKNAPWLSERLRRRISDFETVLGCRFPTVIDVRSSPLGKSALRALASWRFRYRRYNRPWELDLSKKLVRVRDPRALSL